MSTRVWSTSTMLTAGLAGLAAPATALAVEPAEQGSPGGSAAPVEQGEPATSGEPSASEQALGVVSTKAQAPTAAAHKHRKHHRERRRGQRRKGRRHSNRRAGRMSKPLRLDARAARRTGGTLWIAPPKPAPTSALSTTAAPLSAGGETLGAGAPVVLPAGLATQRSHPPAYLVRIFKQAGHRYHVPWRVLAAINSIETDYGRDLSVSPKGAVGWMQFMPGTWHTYGQGGNPYDPRDAIFAAARLLHAAGASHDLRGAIFAYNHAAWYVAAVLWRASTIDARAHAADGKGGYALPLDAHYMHTLGRTDDGVDIETAPDGAAVYSITPGVVIAVASNPGGFGPNYPVVLATAGPLAGQYVYYGHVAASLVQPGEQVSAGQPIAIVGHTGDAAPLGHGHIEIGFCDSSGDPLDHHGPVAWTPSGQVMRSVLVSLAAKFGISNF